MFLRIISAIGIASCLYGQEPGAVSDRSETNGGQLVVHGGTPSLRAEIIQDGERIFSEIDGLVGALGGKAHPTVVEIFPAEPGKPGAMRRELFSLPEQEDGGFRFQIYLRMLDGQRYDRKGLNRLMLELFLIERGIRGRKAGGLAPEVSLDPWLVDGIQEALAWKAKKGDRVVYKALRDQGGWMPVEKIIEQKSLDEMDALSRELFRASAGALTMALLAQPEGKGSMNAFLLEASEFQGEPLELLRKHFPDINLGREGLEKWWLSQVAAMAAPGVTQTMTIPQTEKELGEALKLYLTDEEGKPVIYGLEAWREVMALEKNEDRLAAVSHASDLLTNLSYRCFPTYRPVVGGYLKFLSDLTGEKRDHLPEVLDNLEMFREAEKRRHDRLIDLLDWYHLSTVQEESGEFDDYLQLKKELEKVEVPDDDPIIRYVDEAQKLFEKRKQVEGL
ncbi:MAG: hypothetical protein ACSHYF_05765 [Verrucomicrobiaceae bacterium]